ncbi:shikimate 5-dehydrogenase [Buchnera aphidicola str. Bp (Baizongia pistaciae)]|uniref:Shikimate dehydrogenase (NADP(+)) n=1 Tax=Buchnera aphidicola subsp. Baizongia pistaciae (strain Bp) TaxID=224915 RepID=AROE_BUCBP|nr:shikimate dehydrogenase [Buchnera aphidicola]P59414.1 RecName: Full=Shikimate dehydrogenase (NADP(+)); Short=SDH [Buchnera aphidicola str. Bp (Baizongia pistaciae)]AAO27143.1 shikimate 5-dehydrogenase [Buchnera aphidicola str. Bp (Baizongia pistaciae)]
MVKHCIDQFCVFGNPINHTQSPYIHSLFSKQTGIVYEYSARLVPFKEFNSYVLNFFLNKGKGANITVPFKENAYVISNNLTIRAKMSRAVNTFKKLHNNKILGDNTDGIGVLHDLKRIKFIKSKFNRVLLIGAGGAARGIIFSLLSYGCSIVVLNRTITRALQLVEDFKNVGSISIFKEKFASNYSFNLIINATTINICQNSNLSTIKSLIHKDVYCYDINYSIKHKYTEFLLWCIKNGAICVSNGIGMLVSQAAHSFYLWYGILPETNSIICKLNRQFYML